MIAQLQQELVEDTVNIEKTNTDIANQEQVLANKANAYKSACETKKSKIADDIQKINTYLNK